MLARAIEDVGARLTWDQETFAYADAWDEGSGRYAGLAGGSQATTRVDASSVTVRQQ